MQTKDYPLASSIREAAQAYFERDVHMAYEEGDPSGRVMHVAVGSLLMSRSARQADVREQYRADAVLAYWRDRDGSLLAEPVVTALPDQWDAAIAEEAMVRAVELVRMGGRVRALQEAQQAVTEAESALAVAMAERDEMVRLVRAGGMSVEEIMEAASLSRARVYQVLSVG